MTDAVPAELDARPGLRWVRLCSVDELSEDEGLRVETKPAVSVYLSGGEYFCIDDTCSHETYSLAEGWVDKCVVECPLHFATFSLRSGAALSGPTSVPVRSHPVALAGDELFAALPEGYNLP